MTVELPSETAFVLLMVFARLGGLMVVLPGLSKAVVPARIRLGFALALTIVMVPVLAPGFPALPDAPFAALRFAVVELVTGLLIGLTVRLVMGALSIAGTAIAMQTGLGFAEAVDPTGTAPPATLFAGFLSVLAVTLILVTDLHHVLIHALADSYLLFRPGTLAPAGDVAETALATMTGAFKVAVQISAPFLLFGLIFHVGSGVLSRLLPRVQIFFLAVPASILIGFILLMTTIGVMLVWFLQHFETALGPFLR